jgi:hypothetical protein
MQFSGHSASGLGCTKNPLYPAIGLNGTVP